MKKYDALIDCIIFFGECNDLNGALCHGVVCTWTHTLRHNSLDITLHIANHHIHRKNLRGWLWKIWSKGLQEDYVLEYVKCITSPMFHLKVGFWTHRHVVNTVVQLYLKRTTRGNTNLVSEWKNTILSITLSLDLNRFYRTYFVMKYPIPLLWMLYKWYITI